MLLQIHLLHWKLKYLRSNPILITLNPMISILPAATLPAAVTSTTFTILFAPDIISVPLIFIEQFAPTESIGPLTDNEFNPLTSPVTERELY